MPGSNAGSLSDWYRKEKLSTKNDEESSFVDKRVEISNLDLIRDMVDIISLGEISFNIKNNNSVRLIRKDFGEKILFDSHSNLS